ncbi:outer membrane receptor protein [Ornithobacterium rhinotracheale DSM 15997]|uniref:Outer membrane receptor protein n=2 Tax=Ornithobacterium rhinotracheale TaxID=28251 RepID=I3ZYD3_ORNRL|nr:outer membrane receptor protein [Ornithobacterium rhinotracheale DSM 15997]
MPLNILKNKFIKRMKKYAWLLFLFCVSVFAQNVHIKGNLHDAENFPIPYAHITFENIKDDKIFKETYTESNGEFSIEIPAGTYEMSIQPVNGGLIKREKIFNKDTDFGIIQIEAKSISLSEVNAVGSKPLYRLELDKRVYDMERDPSVRGASISDALNNVPSIQVDTDGTISLRGNTNLRVLIDGKPSAMTGISNVADALKNLPAESVQRVEVITNPSARYDAEGTAGIINIIMKKGSNIGFNANFNTTLGIPEQESFSANMNFKTKKWNFFINPNIRHSNYAGKRSFNNAFFDTAGKVKSRETQNGETQRKRFSTGVNLGVEHYISDKTSVTLSGNFNYREGDNLSTLNYNSYAYDELVGKRKRITTERAFDRSVEGVFSLKHEFNDKGHELNFVATSSYSPDNARSNIQAITELGTQPNLSQRSFNPESSTRNLLKLDYVLPLQEKARFEFGYKGEWQSNTSDYAVQNLDSDIWITKKGFADVLDYDQNIQAVYSQYGNKHGRFSYLFGLRMEHSDIKIASKNANKKNNKNYSSWFPSASLNYSLDDKENNQIQITYSRRIRRPMGRFLSPFNNYSDDRNVFIGNPDLDPTFSDAYELSYITQIGKVSITPSVYYRHSKDEINVFRRRAEIDGNQTFITQPINAGSQNSYGMEFIVSAPLAKWWRMFSNFNFYKYKMDAIYHDPLSQKAYDLSRDAFNWSGRISNNLKLPGKIETQLSAFYYGPVRSEQSKSKAMYGIDLGMSKDVLKGNGTLTLNVRDILNSRKRRVENYGEDYFSEMEMQWRPRSMSLSFSYRINQKKKRERGNREDMGGDEMMEF